MKYVFEAFGLTDGFSYNSASRDWFGLNWVWEMY